MEDSYLDSAYVTCHINELYATVDIIQTFYNSGDKALELVIQIPHKRKAILKKFTAKIGNDTVTSKILPLENAQEKYSDSISSGNVAMLGYFPQKGKVYEFNIGNLAPREEIELRTEFIQLISHYRYSYKFSFSIGCLPQVRENYKSYQTFFSAELTTNFRITKVSSTSHQIEQEVRDDKNSVLITISPENAKSGESIDINFQTEKMNTRSLYEQYDPFLDNYAYMLNYPEDSILTSQSENNSSPGYFIFLIDQSGSMQGNPITIVAQAVKLFLQSLPYNSYFDLIGFGSIFHSYCKCPLLYNSQNVSQVSEKIKNLAGNMGGTNIYEPLKYVFERSYDDLHSEKNIFLLTDGEVENSEDCLSLIKDNSSNFRTHAIGIGNSVDKKFISDCGEAGKGFSYFSPNLTQIRQTVVEALHSSIKQSSVTLNFETNDNSNTIAKIIEYPCAKFLKFKDEMVTYSFICEQRLKNDVVIHINEKELSVKDILLSLEEGDGLSKCIVGNSLKKKNQLLSENEEIELSRLFQVPCRYTGLFAENTKSKSNSTELSRVNIVKIPSFRLSNSKTGKHGHAKTMLEVVPGGSGHFSEVISPSLAIVLAEKMKKNRESTKEFSNAFYDKILATQNMFDGSWDASEYFDKIQEKYKKEYDNIENYINCNHSGISADLAQSLIRTILVIFFLKEVYEDKFGEYILIVNKAKNYVRSQGIDYDKIVNDAELL